MTITALPTPPSRSDSANFATRGDAFMAALPTFATEANALQADVNAKQATASAAATSATASAAAALVNANNAAADAGAALWVSGTTYSLYAIVRSPLNSQTYKRIVAGAGTTDPSADTTNWAPRLLDVSTTLPSMRPSLLLDFARSRSVDGRITFTRASIATRTNANGLIETVASGVPRIDFDPITGACKGLLVEESRANLLLYSEAFNDATWTKNSSSITSNAVAAPDGTTTADKLVEDSTASNTHAFYQTVTSSATSATYSFYVKAAERSQLVLQCYTSPANTGGQALFDLLAKTTSLVTSIGIGTSTASIVDVGNGWLRCILSITGTSSTSIIVNGFISVAGTNTYSGDGTSGIYIWGAQLEAGSFATSYIPTTSAQVTRAADVATMTGANFSSWYRADEGSFVVSADMTSPSTYSVIAQVDDGTTGNRIYMDVFSSNARLASTVSSANQGLCTLASVSTNTAFTVAGAYKLNDYSASLNGATPVTDATGTITTVSQLRINTDGANALNGCIARLAYYPKRLTNAELQALSA